MSAAHPISSSRRSPGAGALNATRFPISAGDKPAARPSADINVPDATSRTGKRHLMGGNVAPENVRASGELRGQANRVNPASQRIEITN
jgi:hypothetical protein